MCLRTCIRIPQNPSFGPFNILLVESRSRCHFWNLFSVEGLFFPAYHWSSRLFFHCLLWLAIQHFFIAEGRCIFSYFIVIIFSQCKSHSWQLSNNFAEQTFFLMSMGHLSLQHSHRKLEWGFSQLLFQLLLSQIVQALGNHSLLFSLWLLSHRKHSLTQMHPQSSTCTCFFFNKSRSQYLLTTSHYFPLLQAHWGFPDCCLSPAFKTSQKH